MYFSPGKKQNDSVANMNIFLTYDYELFFGKPAGSLEKSILYPSQLLMDLAEKHGIGMTYFVDVGYLLRLEKFKTEFPQLQQEYEQVVEQLKTLQKKENALQLHIHPHWEKSWYDGKEWIMVVDDCYKLTDFQDDEILEIVTRYKQKLEAISEKPVQGFRAGGWCLQPFDRIRPAFIKNNIRFDSTVYPGAYFETEHYFYDFRTAPGDKGHYRFEDDLCKENEQGFFTEYPIASWKYNPLFYWQLYGWGRLRPDRHKMIGDGMFIPQPGKKYTNLTRSGWNHVSCDGYYASVLKKVTKTYAAKGRTDLVVIGHPKSMTRFGLEKLDAYIAYAKKNQHKFRTFDDLI